MSAENLWLAGPPANPGRTGWGWGWWTCLVAFPLEPPLELGSLPHVHPHCAMATPGQGSTCSLLGQLQLAEGGGEEGLQRAPRPPLPSLPKVSHVVASPSQCCSPQPKR